MPAVLKCGAHAQRFRARLSADAPESERLFTSATELFRELGYIFYLAVTLLEYGEWLTGQDRPAEAGPFLVEARETFERLAATPWLERAARVAPTEDFRAAAVSPA